MPYTYDTNLPSEEELTVDEVNLSMAALYAGAHHLGKVCEYQNNEFILCRQEVGDPRKCLQQGKEVTACALDFFRKLKKSCREEFNDYAKCIHKSSSNWTYSPCRNTQQVFDKCVLDNLGIERPPWGWACEVHVHNTKQKKPEPEVLEFPGAPQPHIPSGENKPAKLGGRSMF
ncbi:UNVERIFIED_CONTAM: hypothetical protein PYX00_000121 [Menopon gallinae]|uniref:NADH dehydrogenase [ubiquinone] 1 alpha subcomplex subunit 8 n=1 Tax=Menopon gallinae TaxID=328185 RepID=A0AAW2I7X4_9NEOP